MNFYPAIDLKNGTCVRLVRGKMAECTEFNKDPVNQALIFADAGCQWLHLVDLNGAFSGHPVNIEPVTAIVENTPLLVQLGGGIRDMNTIEKWFSVGITRIILGTVAVKNPALVREACAKFGTKIAIAIDSEDGFVAVQGWVEKTRITDIELAQRFQDIGAGAIIHTDITRDGMMRGPNLDSALKLAAAVTMPVIISGGVASFEDLETIKHKSKGVLDGVISGRAIYEGKVNITDAISLFGSN